MAKKIIGISLMLTSTMLMAEGGRFDNEFACCEHRVVRRPVA